MKNIIAKQFMRLSYLMKGWKRFRSLDLPDGEILFTCGGIGDTLYAGLFIDEYIRERGLKNVTLFAQEGHREIIELCGVAGPAVVYYDDEGRKAFYYYLAACNRLFPNFRCRLLQPKALRINFARLPQIYNLEEIYKRFVFGLNEKVTSPPSLTLENLRFHGSEIMEDAILIMMESNSLPTLSDHFWLRLIEKLSAGYRIYVNGKKGLELDKYNVTDIRSYSCMEIFELSPQFRCVISARSGICDLLSRRACNLIVLYPYVPKMHIYQSSELESSPHAATLTEIQKQIYGNEDFLIKELVNIIERSKS